MSRGTRLASAAAAILLPAGAAVLFIAGRDESQRAATARNLADVGYNPFYRIP